MEEIGREFKAKLTVIPDELHAPKNYFENL